MTRWIKRSVRWLNLSGASSKPSSAPPQVATQPLPARDIYSVVATTLSPHAESTARIGTSMPDRTASPPKQATSSSETTGQQSRQAVPILPMAALGTSLAPTAATPPPGAPDEPWRHPHNFGLQDIRLHRWCIHQRRDRHLA